MPQPDFEESSIYPLDAPSHLPMLRMWITRQLLASFCSLAIVAAFLLFFFRAQVLTIRWDWLGLFRYGRQVVDA